MTGHSTSSVAAWPPVAIATLLVSVVTAGCASAPPAQAPLAHWDRPSEELRTLTLDPRTVRFVRAPGDAAVVLAIGGIFVRAAAPDAPGDALGLLVVVGDAGAALIEDGAAQIHLEIDQVVFDGAATPRGVIRGPGHRSSFLVEVSPDVLEALVTARTVRGRVGSSMAFVLPPENRSIFRDFLDQLPADAFARTTASRR